jgi:endoglucanase
MVFLIDFARKTSRRTAAGFLPVAALMFVLVCQACAPSPKLKEKEKMPEPESWVSPYQRYGKIRVADFDHDGDPATAPRRQLCDERGTPIQLWGMSSFGLQWPDGDWILTDEVFDVLAYDWQVDSVRLAMYVTEDGYASHPAELLAKVEKGIELASERGMFILLDYHGLSPGTPNDPQYLNAGIDLPEYATIRKEHPEFNAPELFFTYLVDKYKDLEVPFFIEPFNEPNQLGGSPEDTWRTVLLPYFQSVTDAVRIYDPAGRHILLYGSDQWSQLPNSARYPVYDPTGQNMMTAHIYTGEKAHENIKVNIRRALDGGLAVFVSEWGTSAATGDGGPFIDSAEKWCEFFDHNLLSWCSWSLARKKEVSSSTLPNTSAHPVDTDGDGIANWDWNKELSVTGRFIRAKIRGEPTPLYDDGTGTLNNGDVRFQPVDDKGGLVKLPFDFESGQREGWTTEGSSALNYLDIRVADAETKALCFPVYFNTTNNTWEDGARISSSHFPESVMNLSIAQRIKGVSLDVYIEEGKMTIGSLGLTVCPIPDGDGYWYQTEQYIIDMKEGDVIPSPGGQTLLKYHVRILLSQDGSYPFTVRIRNLILVLQSLNSDYIGNIYYDNIDFFYDH